MHVNRDLWEQLVERPLGQGNLVERGLFGGEQFRRGRSRQGKAAGNARRSLDEVSSTFVVSCRLLFESLRIV